MAMKVTTIKIIPNQLKNVVAPSETMTVEYATDANADKINAKTAGLKKIKTPFTILFEENFFPT